MMPKILLALILALLSDGTAQSTPAENLRGDVLLKALQSGGYTILVRHARTDRTAPNKETPGTVPPLRADQRNLSAAGEGDVRLMQEVVRKYALPISEVISSPTYRCRETADAFGPATITMTLRTFPTTAETAALVAAAPKPGTNRVLVTHHFVIENHVPGIVPGDIDESEAAVVRPAGNGKVTLIGKIKLGDWSALAGGGVQSSSSTIEMRHEPPAAAALEPAAIPATAAGLLAAGYIEAFNSGDAERMRAFTEKRLLANPERPTEVRVQGYVRLFAEYGPLTITGIDSSTNDRIALRARSKRGELIVTVTASETSSDRAQSVTFGILGGGGGH